MQDSQSKPARRGFIFGAAAAGAAVAAVATLPAVRLAETGAEPLKPAPEKGGGYSLSDHVKRYYKTTRI